jgi:hypothetical protein
MCELRRHSSLSVIRSSGYQHGSSERLMDGSTRRSGPVLGDGAAAAEAVASTCAEPTCDPHPGRSGPGRPGRAPRRPGFRQTSRKALIQVVCFIH